MQRNVITIILLSAVISLNAQKAVFPEDIYDFLENTGIYEINQEDGHVPLVPYETVTEALSGIRAEAGSVLMLNGSWRFHLAAVPEEAPGLFFSEEYSDADWDTIRVPSNWEMEGFGDPLFRNISTPFTPDPPNIPREYNPTGSYRKIFYLPPSWKGKEIFLRMEKTASASFVWINGYEVGYNEGAQEPAEYNITKYVREGSNLIAVRVYKYSDGYYLEDQDYWRLAGIFDDVWLFATPARHIFDWYAVTDLDDTYTDALLDLVVDVKNYESEITGSLSVRATLYDQDMEEVTTFMSELFTVPGGSRHSAHFSDSVYNPAKWSAEYPSLYTLTLELIDQSGETEEVISGRIGFKETEITDQVFYLNGVPVKLNGINSHMQHPKLGHTMNEETIRRDMSILKQFNINCVRTSHYPPVTCYLDLADEYGIYIIDETGDESHATEYVSERKDWEGMYRERARKMVLRDRNHPSVLFWSAGNESGEGDNICAVIEEGKRYDRSRYWMYGGNAFSQRCEEIIGPRYPQLYNLVKDVLLVPDSVDPRPSFLDEYLAVTGNGGGALDDYWRIFYSYPRSMGGAIWDFISTGITEKVRTLKDASDNDIQVNVMGHAVLSAGVDGRGIDLNGHDQWVEIYRDKALEISGDKLTLSLWVYPRSLSSSEGTLITKGNWQFGIDQVGKDSLEYYITTRRKERVRIALPDDWEYNWHHVIARYDGNRITLKIDDEESIPVPLTGRVLNTPYPVNIGRNCETHGQETSVYISDCIIDQVGIFPEIIEDGMLADPSEDLKRHSALWLDFEEMGEEGEFFSYGIGGRTYGTVWPDRRPQPEMWQIKKSAQPVSIRLISSDKGLVEITNRHMFRDLRELDGDWIVEGDGKVLEKGTLHVDLKPGESRIVSIPYNRPVAAGVTEYRLMVRFCLREESIWADKGFEIAWEQMKLPWSGKMAERSVENVSSLVVKDDDETLRVSGEGFEYLFDKKRGALSAIEVKGRKVVKEGGIMNLWRAPLANETDEWAFRASNSKHRTNGFGRNASTEWYSTGLDRTVRVVENLSVKKADNNDVTVAIKTIVLTGTGRGAFMNDYLYQIRGDGEMIIDHTIIPNGDMPSWLPRIGTKWIFDKDMINIEWYGRGPQENYPDRKSGYRTGVYEMTVDEMYEPYLIPQDYGLRCDNRWVRITDKAGTGLMFTGDKPFNFNTYPYSTDNLTKALYTYQLHPFEGITFNLDYATSGVGGTALSVFPEYQVMPQRYDFRVVVKPVMAK